MAKTILDILVSKKTLSQAEANEALQKASKKGAPIDDTLYERGISENDIAEAKSELTGYPVQRLGDMRVPSEILKIIPEESSSHYQMIPIGKNDGYLDVGMVRPEDIASQEALKFIGIQIDMPIRIFVITKSDFESTVKHYSSLTGEVGKVLSEFEKVYEALGDDINVKKERVTKLVEEAPVTKMFAVILRHAVEGKASDIHIEPTREKLRVRFRVDGTLHTSLLLPSEVHLAIVTRIKVTTNLKIDETRIPQDGRFQAEVMGRHIDFRVSTFPTALGEKVVIRILDPDKNVTTLDSIGLRGRNLTLIEENIKKPYGLILVTGPTGSGKSTTLFAILNLLNQEKSNIVSLEDPVEYFIEGVNQSHVRPEIGYTFATGLRHILRQDPDIIMVGEIRDAETAALAVHAALTGHLVLSTLHTNTASGVIPRLIDMGVDPFLISATLVLAVGQRLVRTLCPDSKKEVKLTGKIKEAVLADIANMPKALQDEIIKNMPTNIYQPLISASCPKGSRGRIGVFETIEMTEGLEKILLSSPSEASIAEEARRQGMITMRQDGIFKALDGTISVEDLIETII